VLHASGKACVHIDIGKLAVQIPVPCVAPVGQRRCGDLIAACGGGFSVRCGARYRIDGTPELDVHFSPQILFNKGAGFATQPFSYTVIVSNGYGPVTSNPATVAVNVNAYLANISARAFVGTGSQVLVAGFVVSGSGSKQLLIRGVGPTLAQYSVAGPMANPQLSLFDISNAVIATDIGWSNASTKGPSTVPATISAATSALFNQLYAFPLPAGSADCAMSAGLPVSQYTAQVSGVGGTTGVALVEVYNLP